MACLLLIALAALPPAGASGGVARFGGKVPFGVGDENAAMFEDPRFAWLGVRYARLIVPWNVVRHRGELARASGWLAAAQAGGVQPLVSFNESVSRSNTLPSVSSYAQAVRSFMRRFPWVTHYQTWDEENQASEPTSRDPARAASFFNWLSRACSKCAVTAADVLDGPSMVSWIRRFLHYAHRPTLWGVHPYYELNYGGHEALSLLAQMVRGDIWLTEAGLPVWRYVRAEQRFRFTDDREQERAARRLLGLMRLTRRVSRIYYYQWRSWIDLAVSRAQFRRHRHVAATWDSGLLNPDCSIRPVFVVIARALGRNAAHAPRARRTDHGLVCAPASARRR
jgi:hypothetical protein